ncbi:hypothetical protein T484DRAFT_1780192 [Baffinella frigidus]|nr:hypothetical protein T484DRAFT_1780192 [Cryptophyta sp. CCMP2293]
MQDDFPERLLAPRKKHHPEGGWAMQEAGVPPGIYTYASLAAGVPPDIYTYASLIDAMSRSP